MKSSYLFILACFLTLTLAVLVARRAAAQTVDETKAVKTASGLKMIDTKVGTGAEAKTGQYVTVHYTGWLYDAATKTKGKKFDSSVDRSMPFKFTLGAGKVIKGWDEGVAGMKIGGQRTLIISPELGYGERGAGGAIPPNATLIFDVELLGVE